MEEASSFLDQLSREGVPGVGSARRNHVIREIRETGEWRPTPAELTHGARMAWRNSNRCIGRLYWRSLRIFDARDATAPDEIFQACLHHLRWASNGGRIRPAITVFPPAPPDGREIRIWNSQLVRYAGYAAPTGPVGDPAQAPLTRELEAMGWKGPRGPFDVLPIVVDVPGAEPRLWPLPSDAVLEVPLSHPYLPAFEGLQLRWYAVPVVSDMRLVLGGVHFPAAPFNGWYVGSEIGARNLADVARYDLLPEVAAVMGLDPERDGVLWRDRALLELNAAVLHSFGKAGVTLMDHHTAARHFMRHVEREQAAGRETTGDWTWLVPPLSGSTSPVFHRPFDNQVQTPNFYYQPPAWTQSVGE